MSRRAERLEARVMLTAPQPLLDINPGGAGSVPVFPGPTFTTVGATTFFAATSATGTELWKTDGSPSGTVLVRDINPGPAPSLPLYLTNVNGTLFFSAISTAGFELWKSDGTSAGTVLVRDIHPLPSGLAFPRQLTNVNGTLYFSAVDDIHGRELWRSDGTSSGTVLVSDINPLGGNGLSGNEPLAVLGGVVYFAADDGASGVELWRSDGTSTGTALVRDINPGWQGSSPAPVNVGGTLYFAADDGANGVEPWKSNGTSSGTALVRDVNPGAAGSGPVQFVGVGGTTYFVANDSASGYELWRTNGTSAGTALVRDINPGAANGLEPASGGQIPLQNLNGALFFSANDGVNGMEPWRSSGTSGGTTLIADVNPGALGSLAETSFFPPVFVQTAGMMYFQANDGVNGKELWVSDGTSAGTALVADVNVGAASFGPTGMVATQGTLIGWGALPGTGFEPWTYTPPSTSYVTDIAGPTTVLRGETTQFTLSATGPGIGASSSTTYSIDWDNNGVFDETVVGPAGGAAASHTFATRGNTTIRVQAQVGAQTFSTALLHVAVSDYVLRPQPGNPSLFDLVYQGTPGIDAVYFYYAGGPTTNVRMLVLLENSLFVVRDVTITGVTGNVVASGGDSNDVIVTEFLLFQQAQLAGGSGDDVLVGGQTDDVLDGGSGNDVLFGGSQGLDGDDTLIGGDGGDLLVGNYGADWLIGGGGDDLLISGAVTFTPDLPLAIFAIQAEWLSPRTYAERVANISGVGTGPRANDNYFLTPGVTVLDDGAVDNLLGSEDFDWFLVRLTEDFVGDLAAGETQTGL